MADCWAVARRGVRLLVEGETWWGSTTAELDQGNAGSSSLPGPGGSPCS
ncbi:hypothetical protein [Nonomuraea sp. NPDC050783]